jgi:hypothetical protein
MWLVLKDRDFRQYRDFRTTVQVPEMRAMNRFALPVDRLHMETTAPTGMATRLPKDIRFSRG